MARDIMAPVGDTGCPNLSSDVRILQEMLNQVPQHSGGPPPQSRLTTDGVASAQFWAALDAFRARQPLLVMENKKVNPGSLTMSKLNEFEPLRPLNRNSTMLCPHGGRVQVLTTGKANAADMTLSPLAQCIVVGCPQPPINPAIGQVTGPCQRVVWLPGASINYLDQRSIGNCFSMTGVPVGSVVIASA
ncbi:MAG: hypothetical protein KDE55_08015 [Novosphingobium sp.]|nr:hypothetical protein [Novosphingobium sp.]